MYTYLHVYQQNTMVTRTINCILRASRVAERGLIGPLVLDSLGIATKGGDKFTKVIQILELLMTQKVTQETREYCAAFDSVAADVRLVNKLLVSVPEPSRLRRSVLVAVTEWITALAFKSVLDIGRGRSSAGALRKAAAAVFPNRPSARSTALPGSKCDLAWT